MYNFNFNIEVKYNNIIYVKVSEVLENNKKLGYTKKALKELLDSQSITIKGMGRTKYINKDYILNSIIKSPSDTEDDDIVFLTGVGKVWPIIRSHTVLNNLHRALDKVPVVLFFPGTYDGGSLMLFNEIKDDNYYRAFQLVDKY